MGKSNLMNNAAMAIAEFDSAGLKELTLRETWPEFRDGFVEALRNRQRWAFLLWGRIAGWIAPVDAAVLVIQQVGVPAWQARSAVQLVEDSRQLSEDQRLDMAINALIRHARLNPGDARLKPLAEALAPMNQSAA
jgi:hypothetical protein